MKTNEILELVSLAGRCSYNELNKMRFFGLSMKFLRAVRKELRIDADLRYNRAGIACSGDATLHSDVIYVQFNADSPCAGLGILFRSCQGRRDFTGGRNHWYGFEQLAHDGSILGFVETVRDTLCLHALMQKAA